jgi:HIV Tat-specific factor 1
MNGRFFGGKAVVAYIWDGEEKFKKYHSGRDAAGKTADPLDVDDEENERLERFGDWLESAEYQPDKIKTDKGRDDEVKTSEDNVDETENKDDEVKTNSDNDAGKN